MTVPPGFVPWDRASPLLDRLGDFRRHQQEPGTFGFLVDEPKLNARGLLHAGAISTIADVCIGHTLAHDTGPPESLVTVNLNTSFIGVANVDDWIDVTVRIHRVGGRIATGSAEFHRGSRAIAHATAIFMRSAPREA
jgi:acyl-coenzyme A thioesterase PaaI-like protein